MGSKRTILYLNINMLSDICIFTVQNTGCAAQQIDQETDANDGWLFSNETSWLGSVRAVLIEIEREYRRLNPAERKSTF